MLVARRASGLCVFQPEAVVHSLSCVRLFGDPVEGNHWALLPMGSPRQAYWSGLPCPSPGDLPAPGIKPASSELAGGFAAELEGKRAKTEQSPRVSRWYQVPAPGCRSQELFIKQPFPTKKKATEVGR